MDDLVTKLTGMNHRGPGLGEGSNGKGNSFRGVIEQTPCLWITWVTHVCKIYGVAIEPIVNNMSFFGVGLSVDRVKMRYGYRYYWLCPRCGRRCETIFALRQAGNYVVGCKRRECLHLGYLSQTCKPQSHLRLWVEIFGRENSRTNIPKEVEETLKRQVQAFIDLHGREIAQGIDIKLGNNR